MKVIALYTCTDCGCGVAEGWDELDGLPVASILCPHGIFCPDCHAVNCKDGGCWTDD